MCKSFKLKIVVMGLIACHFSMYGKITWLNNRYKNIIEPNSEYSFSEYKKELNFWMDRLPNSLYRHVIIDNAIVEDVPIEYIYSIAHTETGNFRFMRSIVPNKNGTIDHGIMAVNSANLKKDRFMDTYFYDSFYTRFNINNQYHIGKIGVKYFKDLLNKTKCVDGAIKSYNCGYHAWSQGRVPESTIGYELKISNLIKVVQKERFTYIFDDIINMCKIHIDNQLHLVHKVGRVKVNYTKVLHGRRYLIYMDGIIYLVA